VVSSSSPAPRRSLADHPVAVFWRILRANPLSLFGFFLIAIIGVLALIVIVDPSAIVPYAPTQQVGPVFEGPTWWTKHPTWGDFYGPHARLLGTDELGRDVYSNVMLALPLDLGLSIGIAGISVLIGGGLGLVAGFYDKPGTVMGGVSVTIMRLTDIFLSFPSLILALALTRVLGLGVGPTAAAITITWWPFYVRLVRGEVLAVKHLPYVIAARASGVSEGRILFRHVVRNVLEPVIVYFTLDIGTVLVVYSTIGYIGIASRYPGPQPEWGAMLAFYSVQGAITSYPWLVLAPGVAIFVTVFAFSLLGDGLRDVLDPRTRRAFVRGTSTHDPPAEAPLAPAPVPLPPPAPTGGPSPTIGASGGP
jgi:peptide/nickel transport system permease protein